MTEGRITPKKKEMEVSADNKPLTHPQSLPQKPMRMVLCEVKVDIHGRAKVQVRWRGKAKASETNIEIEMIVVLARTASDMNTADLSLGRRSGAIGLLEMIEVAASRARVRGEMGGPMATGATERPIDEKSIEKKRRVRLQVHGRLVMNSRSEDVTPPAEIRNREVSRKATCAVKEVAEAEAEGTEMTGAAQMLEIDRGGNGLRETPVAAELQARPLAQASVWKGPLAMAKATLRGGLPTDRTHRQAL